MGLINCPECNQKVSDRAKRCPKCGYPLDNIADTNAPGILESNNTNVIEKEKNVENIEKKNPPIYSKPLESLNSNTKMEPERSVSTSDVVLTSKKNTKYIVIGIIVLAIVFAIVFALTGVLGGTSNGSDAKIETEYYSVTIPDNWSGKYTHEIISNEEGFGYTLFIYDSNTAPIISISLTPADSYSDEDADYLQTKGFSMVYLGTMNINQVGIFAVSVVCSDETKYEEMDIQIGKSFDEYAQGVCDIANSIKVYKDKGTYSATTILTAESGSEETTQSEPSNNDSGNMQSNGEAVLAGTWYMSNYNEGDEAYRPTMSINTANGTFTFNANLYSGIYPYTGSYRIAEYDTGWQAICYVDNPAYGYNCDSLSTIIFQYDTEYEEASIWFEDDSGYVVEYVGVTANGEYFY